MKFYILYDCDDGLRIIGVPRKQCIEAETLEKALQKYNLFKERLKGITGDNGDVVGLERIDQEEIVTKIL